MKRSQFGVVGLLLVLSSCDAAKVLKTDSVAAVQISSDGEVSSESAVRIARSEVTRSSSDRDAEQNQQRNDANRTVFESGDSVMWCSEGDDWCWSTKPENAAACTIHSGSEACKCAANDCNIETETETGDFQMGHCADRMIFISKGKEEKHDKGDLGLTGKSEEIFCKNMKLLDQWNQLNLLAPENKPEELDKGWWGCLFKSGYTWESGKCLRKERFLGEFCWGGGECASGDGDYKVVCHEATCKASYTGLARNKCECSWTGWNFLIACSAANDACHGHACVSNVGLGGKYCDYYSGQSWNSLR